MVRLFPDTLIVGAFRTVKFVELLITGAELQAPPVPLLISVTVIVVLPALASVFVLKVPVPDALTSRGAIFAVAVLLPDKL